MKLVVLIAFSIVSSISFAQTKSVSTLTALKDILPLNQDLVILKGETIESSKKSCDLVVMRRDYMQNASSEDKTIDLGLMVDGKVILTLHLKSELKSAAKDYESEFDFNVVSQKQIELYSSVGHMTDQYRGFNGYLLKLERHSESQLDLQLEHSWADDDGMSGGSKTSCVIKI